MTPLVYFVCAAATFRLTRLFSEDTITDGLRNRLDTVAVRGVARLRDGRPPTVVQRAAAFTAEGLGCPWCSSVWWAALVAGMWCWLAAPDADTGLLVWWAATSVLVSSAFTGAVSWLLAWVDPDRIR